MTLAAFAINICFSLLRPIFFAMKQHPAANPVIWWVCSLSRDSPELLEDSSEKKSVNIASSVRGTSCKRERCFFISTATRGAVALVREGIQHKGMGKKEDIPTPWLVGLYRG